ncbi:hypothetical protein [Janthinobacterium sp. RB2R34]|uniref:hypothetical protein n=1 Tax=Janthinobacterium sp. RB2R34 TaxID=3424193 RepID=UPI003F1EC557
MIRLNIAIGLSLLYASAYFMGFLNPLTLYFVPSFFDYVVYPSIVTVFCLVPVILMMTSSLFSAGIKRKVVFFGAIALTIVAIKSAFDAADYPWVKIVPLIMPAILEPAKRLFLGKIVLLGGGFIFVFGVLHLSRTRLSQWIRFLSTLGYAFVFLAIYRCIALDFIFQPALVSPYPKSEAAAPTVARRVVWVIFDEMDYTLSLKSGSGMSGALPNFSALTARAISANQAFSPGQDTVYSIPALLTGTALSGITIKSQNRLDLWDQQKKIIRFGLESSIFSQLPGGVRSATVLGFYHPYCKIFSLLQSCGTTYAGNAGRWFDSLTFFSVPLMTAVKSIKGSIRILPESVLYNFDYMYRASENVLSSLDKTLSNQHSAFDFIHVNLPHLPNIYVQRLLKEPVENDTSAYKQNLIGADIVVGRIVKNLQLLSDKQNILLIVSSDHWLRTNSKQPASVPFIVWKVGASEPIILPDRISTVHSKKLALDFLSGKLDTQAALSDALRRTTYYETWSAPDGYKY